MIRCKQYREKGWSNKFMIIWGGRRLNLWRCLMFKNASRPKAIFTLWILLNRKLETVDRLAKWGMTLDKSWVICENADERMDYMLIQCHYAGEVWERLLKWIDNHSSRPWTWTQFIQWSIQNGKGKTTRAQLFKRILAEGVYGLWNERNKRIF